MVIGRCSGRIYAHDLGVSGSVDPGFNFGSATQWGNGLSCWEAKAANSTTNNPAVICGSDQFGWGDPSLERVENIE